ncbi:hypothetical protein XE98_000687 [Salmonella enterica subsp. enterica]|nr:hypothetical protein [Salmonella enterica subsp. enterica]
MGFCFGRQLLAKKPASAGFFMVAACTSPGLELTRLFLSIYLPPYFSISFINFLINDAV